jgi:hypothetical protein
MNLDGGPPLDGVPFSEAVIASQAAWHETRAYCAATRTSWPLRPGWSTPKPSAWPEPR